MASITGLWLGVESGIVHAVKFSWNKDGNITSSYKVLACLVGWLRWFNVCDGVLLMTPFSDNIKATSNAEAHLIYSLVGCPSGLVTGHSKPYSLYKTGRGESIVLSRQLLSYIATIQNCAGAENEDVRQ